MSGFSALIQRQLIAKSKNRNTALFGSAMADSNDKTQLMNDTVDELNRNEEGEFTF